MPPFMQSCSYGALRMRMLLLYALNSFDMMFTKFLLATGKFREINPVMALAMQNNWATLILKFVLPAVLLIYLDSRLKCAEPHHLWLSARVLEVLIGVYCFVSMLHLWLYYISL